jgi:ribosomal protein S27E
MTYARKVFTTFELSCPKCDEVIVEPATGSQFWDRQETCPAVVNCPNCKTELVVPKGAK